MGVRFEIIYKLRNATRSKEELVRVLSTWTHEGIHERVGEDYSTFEFKAVYECNKRGKNLTFILYYESPYPISKLGEVLSKFKNAAKFYTDPYKDTFDFYEENETDIDDKSFIVESTECNHDYERLSFNSAGDELYSILKCRYCDTLAKKRIPSVGEEEH